MSSIANAIFITDRGGRIVWANEAFSQLTGYTVDEVLGHSPEILKSGRQDAAFYEGLWQTILAGKVWQGEVVERRKDGMLYTVEETITPLFGRAGGITHFISIQHMVFSSRKEREMEHFLAYNDSLTGLPNRVHFLRLLDNAIQHSERRDKFLALLFVDLDHFKPVNDTFGHNTGDLLLRAVADRLRSAVRKTDTVARMGGDEFTVLEASLDNKQSPRLLARKLVRTLGRPYMINHQELKIGASIGIAIFPDDGDDAEALLNKADAAMYRAKSKKKSRSRQ